MVHPATTRRGLSTGVAAVGCVPHSDVLHCRPDEVTKVISGRDVAGPSRGIEQTSQCAARRARAWVRKSVSSSIVEFACAKRFLVDFCFQPFDLGGLRVGCPAGVR